MSIPQIESLYREIRGGRRKKARQDLPEPGRTRIERACGTAIADIAICHDDWAARLTESIGVPAFAAAGGVFVHPGAYDPVGERGLQLLTHEIAHVLQQAGQEPSALHGLGPGDPLEQEADALAEAVRLGRALRIEPRPDTPALQLAWPLIVLLLAAGVVLTTVGAYEKMEAESQRRLSAGPPPEPHLHETMWGLVPFAGSVDQILNGDNLWTKLGGACFLILDCSLVGGLAAKLGARALGKSTVVFSTGKAVQEGLKEAARGGGTAAQRKAYQELVEAAARGEIRLGTQAEIEQLAKTLVRGGQGPVVIAGSTGRLSHSVTCLIIGRRIYRLHGGISRFAYRVTEKKVGKTVNAAWLRRFNRFTVYAGKDLLTDAALREQIEFMAKYSQGLGNRAINSVLAPGCAGTQALLLERLGLHTARGPSRYIPYLLDRSRVGGRLGAHYLVNPGRARFGLGLHSGLLGLATGAYLDRDLSILRGGATRLAESYFAHNVAPPTSEAILLASMDDFDLTDELVTPEDFDVLFPEQMTFSSEDLSTIQLNEIPNARSGKVRTAFSIDYVPHGSGGRRVVIRTDPGTYYHLGTNTTYTVR